MEPLRPALDQVAHILTGSDASALQREAYLPAYNDRYVPHTERYRAFRAMVAEGIVVGTPPTGLTRHFECATCHGTGSTYDSIGERPCWSCDDSYRDVNIPTTVFALASWASLGRDQIEAAEQNALAFLAIARERFGWESMEGSRNPFDGTIAGLPAVTWKFMALGNGEAYSTAYHAAADAGLPLPSTNDFTTSEMVAQNSVCGRTCRGLRMDGTMPDGEVIAPVRALWDARIVMFDVDPGGVTLAVRGLAPDGSARPGKK